MADGKIRHQNHIIDSRAIQFIQNKLPIEWVTRQMNPDYGIDLDLELFGYENNKCVTLGEHVFLQVKGTESAQYGKVKPFGNAHNKQDEEILIDVLKFSIEVPLLKLVERMGSAIPVLLIVVDLKTDQAYHICLNDYIRFVLPDQCPNFRTQKTVTIYIPIENKISNATFMWYGKRPKMYALFQEIYAVSDMLVFTSREEQVAIMKVFVDRIFTYDVWSILVFWGYMELLYGKLFELYKHDLISEEAKTFLVRSMEDGDKWEEHLFYPNLMEEPVKGYLYAQVISCKKFLEYASATSCCFENEQRHLGLPTLINQQLKDVAELLKDRFD